MTDLTEFCRLIESGMPFDGRKDVAVLIAAVRERDAEIARLRKAAKWAATMLGGASLPGWKRGEIGNLFKHFCEEYPDLAPGAK